MTIPLICRNVLLKVHLLALCLGLSSGEDICPLCLLNETSLIAYLASIGRQPRFKIFLKLVHFDSPNSVNPLATRRNCINRLKDDFLVQGA